MKESPNQSRRNFLKASSSLVAARGLVISTDATPQGEVKTSDTGSRSIAIENKEFRLVIGEKGIAESLLHKASGSECLAHETNTPAFSVTQYRPYNNELQLRYPAKAKTFPAKSVRREGDRLIVNFELVDHEATIRLKITEAYIAFSVERLQSRGTTVYAEYGGQTPIDEMVFLQLPIRDRANFGEWLNVMWDRNVAVNVLATDPYPQIDAQPRTGYHLFQAITVDEVGTEGVGAALIVTAKESLLDRIARVEEDFNLPRGVESRRRPEYKLSYYWMGDVTPQNVDRHIAYARQGGFRTAMIFYLAFARTPGHFPWCPEYPNGIEDLQTVVRKIKSAGIIPGLHFHYNKSFDLDAYVSPKPDARLNLRRIFTLACPLEEDGAMIAVEEDPRGCNLASAVRYLKIGDELILYDTFTTHRPYQFVGCKRGQCNTMPAAYHKGTKFGLLGEVAGVIGVFDQKTSIQEEVALRLGNIYREAEFEFAYFDGAEDVPPPYWFTVSWAQWLVYKALQPKPLFSEGACKSHFSWHILSRGNAFDIFKPESIKAAIRAHPCEEAPRIAKDFTGLNFGWVGYWVPSKETVGTQPDMLEFVTSRAAAWDCPFSFRGSLDLLDAHPRTIDNLEVIRRWEEVRGRNWLNQTQKKALRNLEQEHILLINEKKDFELVPYERIGSLVDPGGQDMRAFVFERAGKVYVVYWCVSGHMTIQVPLPSVRVRLLKALYKEEISITRLGTHVILPADGRRYLECIEMSRREVVSAFERAELRLGG